jgi:hypothetical protein
MYQSAIEKQTIDEHKPSVIITIMIVIIGLLLGYLTTTGTKSQLIRIVDILIIGPLMIYLGHHIFVNKFTTSKSNINLDRGLGMVLIFFGSTTITYNLRNFFAYRGA